MAAFSVRTHTRDLSNVANPPRVLSAGVSTFSRDPHPLTGAESEDRSAARTAGRRPCDGGKGRAESAEGARRLGTSRLVFPPGVTVSADLPSGIGNRRRRFERRCVSSRWLVDAAIKAEEAQNGGDVDGFVRPPRPGRCGWSVGGAVGVHGSSTQAAHFSGTERCASIWACPVCAATIRAERAREIAQAVETWQTKHGGSVVFVTLTMSHKRAHRLGVTLDAALQGWRYLVMGAPWQRQKDLHGIAGYVRAVEVTWGEANGWHPHIHALLFLDDTPTPARLRLLEKWLYERWARGVVKHGGGLPSELRGVDLRLADEDGRIVGQYLAKVQETREKKTYDVGSELARSDWKTSRHGGREVRLMPLETLDYPDDPRSRGLWLEYVEATKGRRAITWSRGLRELLAVGDERTDDEIIEDAEKSDLAFTIDAERWATIRRVPLLLAHILEAVEIDRPDAAEHLASGRYVMIDEWWIDTATGETIRPQRPRASTTPQSIE